MLFFRSEETLSRWCDERGIEPNPTVTMEQLWELATTWYATRLQEDSRRPQAEEIEVLFARLGLRGEFWDPRAR